MVMFEMGWEGARGACHGQAVGFMCGLCMSLGRASQRRCFDGPGRVTGPDVFLAVRFIVLLSCYM